MLELRTFSRFLMILFIVLAFATSHASSFASGITYTGRIIKDDAPIDSGVVRFYVWVQTQGGCDLYAEQRDVDMTSSSGTYSFEIGSGALASSFPHSGFGVATLSDVFDNSKSTSDLDTSKTGCLSFTPAADEGRVLKVQFLPPGEAVAQALPNLVVTAVPTARMAFNSNKVGGYGTGDLLKVDPTVTKTTYANGALTQAQYDEFWKLILGTSTTYLKAIPTLGGDISGTLPAVTVTKIQNVAVTAPTTGDTGKVLTYNGTGMVWQTAAGGGITSINGLSGSTQSFATGTAGTDVAISSSGSTHTLNVPTASATNRGALSSSDWSTFNAKQSSSLANGKVWIGNASGAAEAQTLSGDATVSASGNVTVDKTQTAQASKILQLDSSGNAYVNGVDIKGSGAVSASIRYTGSSNMVMNLPTTSGNANQFLQTDGAGNLSWASQSAMLPAISAGQVWVGNASGGAQAFSLSGDVASVSNTGAVTLSASATGSNKLPLAGGTMSGAINMGGNNITNAGDVSLAAGKFLGLGAGSTAGTVAGQIWYDSGVIKYFDGTTAKSLGVAGAGITSLNGLTAATQSFVVGSAGNAPAISSAGSAHTLDIPMASASGSVTAGLISNADYVSFSGKQSNSLAAGEMWVGNASGVAQSRVLSGDIFSVSNTGLVTVNKTTTAQSNYILALDGSGVGNMAGVGLVNGGTVTLSASGTSATYSLKLPAAAPANNQILKSNATGDLSWVTYLAQVSDSAPLANGKMWIGNASGVASEIAMSGDATISNAGLLTLKNTGTVGTYTKVVTDAQGRVVSGSALASGDVTTALGFTPVNKAGDSMSGDLTTQNINMVANKYLGLSANSTDGTVAGQMWYDSGVIKYFDGTTTKSLGVAGAGITNLNGLSVGTQSFAVGTAGTDFAISSAGSAHTFNLPSASATNRGALTSADWSTFNAKQGNALTAASLWVGNSSGGAQARALSGDITIDNVGLVSLKATGSVGTYYKVVTDAQGRVVSGSSSLSATDLPSLTDGMIWIGNSGNTAVGYAMSGDATMSNVGLLTLKNTGTVGTYFKVVTDAQGRVTSGSALASGDVTTALGFTPVNRAGDTMAGALNFGANDITNTGNISMAANKYFGLSANSTNGTVAGQMWYDSGTIKYFDGTTTKSLGVAGAGITSLNGLTAGTQSFVIGSAGNAPAFTSAGSAHTLNIPMASASGSVTAGLISNADYVNFNSKQSNALIEASVWVGNSTGGAEARALSGDVVGVNNIGQVTIVKTTTGENNKILALDGSGVANAYGVGIKGATSGLITLQAPGVTANYSMTLPATSGSANQVLSNTGGGVLSWATVLTGITNSASLTNGKMWIGNASGVASEVAMSGDATISNVGLLTLKNTGAIGTYFKVVTDAQGRVASGSALASGDVTTALGYTPANASLGYINGGNTFAGNATIGLNDGYNLGFKTNNTTQMTIASSGNVGIGTTTPTVKLSVVDTVNDAAIAVSRPAGKEGILAFATGTSPRWEVFTTSAAESGSNAGSNFAINAYDDAGAQLRTDLYINRATGKIGVGMMGPTVSFDMSAKDDAIRLPQGTTAQQPANATGLIRYNTSNNNVEYNNGSGWNAVATSSGSSGAYVNGGNTFAGNATIGLNDNYNLQFKTNNTVKMTLTSDGKLGIGTNPGAALHVLNGYGAFENNTNAIGGPGFSFWKNRNYTATQNLDELGAVSFYGHDGSSTLRSALILAKGDGAPSSGSVPGQLGFFTTASGSADVTERMRIVANGNIAIGAMTPTVSLDISSKTDAIRLPAGTTAQRPANATGLIRYNSSNNNVEFNDGSTWTAFGTGSGLPSISSAQVYVGNSSNGAQARTLSGDITIDNVGLVTLKNTGTVGTYWKVVTDAQGRVSSGSALASGDVTTALGYTPLTSSSGYINGGNTFAGNATIGLNDAYNLGFETNNSTRMTLTGAGDLGVGTASPISKLQVHSTANADNAISISIPGSGNAERSRLHLFTLSDGNALGSTSNNRGWAMGAYGNSYGTGDSNSLDISYWGGATWTTALHLGNTGNVGIGSAVPSYALDIGGKTDAVRLPNGTTAQRPANAAGLLRYNTTIPGVEYNTGAGWNTLSSVTNGVIKDGNSFGAHLIIGTNDNYDFRFEANGSTAMTIEPSGEVGIGTTTPGYKLDIASTDGDALRLNTYSSSQYQGSSTMLYRARGTSGSPTAVQANDTLGGVYTRGYGTTGFGSSSTAYIEFSAAQAFTDANRGTYMVFNTTPNNNSTSTERMRIEENGYVGVGTNSPQTQLHVANTNDAVYLRAKGISDGTSYSSLDLDSDEATDKRWEISHGAGSYNNKLNFKFFANPGWSFPMTIDSGGNVGIGTTGPTTKLQVAGEISPSADNSYPLGDSSLRFTAVYAVNGTIQTSDARQKTNIQNSDLGLDFINKLRPVSYNWKSGPDSIVHYGLIAQETEKAVSESRKQNSDPQTPIVDYDEKTDRYGLRYTELISPVIKAVQELYSRLVGIESRQDAQDRKIASVEASKADKAETDAKIKSLEVENSQLKHENAAIKAYLCGQNPAAPICK